MNTHRDQIRARFRVPLHALPQPWRALPEIAVGGLTGAGFGLDPDSGSDCILITSHAGRGVFDCRDGRRVARDPDPDTAWPDHDTLTCAGIGPLTGTRILVAGLMGGGLHTTATDGWRIDIVAPDWPIHSVLLSAKRGPYTGEPGSTWWHIHREEICEIRAAGFSPSGRTLAIASSCALTLLARA